MPPGFWKLWIGYSLLVLLVCGCFGSMYVNGVKYNKEDVLHLKLDTQMVYVTAQEGKRISESKEYKALPFDGFGYGGFRTYYQSANVFHVFLIEFVRLRMIVDTSRSPWVIIERE